MQPTRFGLVGCGNIAHAGHLPACRAAAAEGLCELVGVCDLRPEAARAAGEACGVPWFTTAAEMFDRSRPEVVSIATLPSSHRELALLAFEAGCHVLCEKPVALDLGQARDMVAAAERAGRLLGICFQYRTWDASGYLRGRIRNGDLGHVHAVRTWGGETYGFGAAPDRYRRESAGGGIIAHWTVHNIDLVSWLLGHPEPLTATSFHHQRMKHYPPALGPAFGAVDLEAVEPGIEDFAMSLLRLEGDTVLTVESNRLQPPSARPEGWELLGSRGAASLAPLRVLLDREGRWVDDTPAEGSLAPSDYDMRRLLTNFLEAVRSGGPSPMSGAEILRSQATIDALYASHLQGQEVAVERG